MSNIEKTNVLPPNVIGQIRGHLKIKVNDINWKKKAINQQKGVISAGLKTINYNIFCSGILLKVLWWGENQQIAQQKDFNKKSKNLTFCYNIHTSAKLFYNYLKNCEPVEFTLTSKISNLHIGTAFVKIPTKILQNCLNSFHVDSCTTEKYTIYNPRNQILGDLELSFNMILLESQTTGISPNASSHSEKSCYSKKSKDIEEKIFKNPILLSSGQSNKNFKCGGTISSRKDTDSSRIMDYLAGRDMSFEDEQLALNEIHRTSPLNSIIVSDLTSTLRSSTNSIKKFSTKRRDVLERIDSLQLKVNYLQLLPPGIREVFVESLVNTTFTVECRISPNLLDKVRIKMDYDMMRFYSDSYDDKNQRIDFNKSSIRSIKIVWNEQDTSIIEHSELLFTIWWRKFGCRQSRCLGTTNFRFTNLFYSKDLQKTKKMQIKSCAGGIHLADLICNITLGTKGVHFGPDHIAIIEKPFYTCAEQDNSLSTSSNSSCSSVKQISQRKILSERNIREKFKATPNNTNTNESNQSKMPESQENIRSSHSSHQSAQTNKIFLNSNFNDEESSEVTSSKEINTEDFCLLQGLLYVGSIKNIPSIENGGYFLVCRAFWKEDATSTDFVANDQFNFVEMFPIINDGKFLDRTRNNHLSLEIWQKTLETSEQLVGIVRLPLHQFFIAFRDKTLTNHLCKANHPVISIDGWSPIVSPLSGVNCGQLQTLLAVGTEEQLEKLKILRGINSDQVYKNSPSSPKIPVPKLPQFCFGKIINCEQESQNSINNPLINAVSTKTDNLSDKMDRREKLSDLLGSFIENLTQQRPQRLQKSQQVEPNFLTNHQQNFINDQKVPAQVRRTSDLLDVLQKALTKPDGAGDCSISELIPSNGVNLITNASLLNPKCCKILLEIECALHLPRNSLKLGNKKSGTQKRNGKEKQNLRFPPNEEPSAYVTFQAEEGYGQMIKSHEGLVYSTSVIEKSSNPSWGKRFEIAVPIDLLLNDEKRFILKVWKKAATNLVQCRLLPTPMEDSIIGFAAIDLTVLMARMPCISGWFNIVDFNGRINGQIKINVSPLEDVMKFKSNPTCSTNSYCKQSPKSLSTALTTDTFVMNSLNGETSSSSSNDGFADLTNTTLSRAIKRKFTELEEITQRLRARLLDVTGEADSNEFPNEIDDLQLDEFERDLNTVCMDEDGECFDNEKFQYENSITKSILNIKPSSTCGQNINTSSTCGTIDDETVSNCSSQERVKMISEFLKRTDIDELSLIKNYDLDEKKGERRYGKKD